MIDPEHLRILKQLDVQAAFPEFLKMRASFGVSVSIRDDGMEVPPEEVCLAGLHKARLMAPVVHAFNKAEKQISRDWLLAHGYTIPNDRRH